MTKRDGMETIANALAEKDKRIAELEEEVERLTKQLRSGVAVQTERTDD